MGLTNGTTYYYKAFSYDTAMNYAGGVTATVTLQVLRIVSGVLGADGCFRLTFTPVSWITNYQAEYSVVLLHTNWTLLGNPILVSNGTPELVDSNPVPSPRYYRVKGMLP